MTWRSAVRPNDYRLEIQLQSKLHLARVSRRSDYAKGGRRYCPCVRADELGVIKPVEKLGTELQVHAIFRQKHEILEYREVPVVTAWTHHIVAAAISNRSKRLRDETSGVHPLESCWPGKRSRAHCRVAYIIRPADAIDQVGVNIRPDIDGIAGLEAPDPVHAPVADGSVNSPAKI